MIIVDKALQQRQREGRPIRVGMVGAGFMARGIALQIETATPGMELVAIANRRIDGATRAYKEAGVDRTRAADSPAAIAAAIAAGERIVTEDALALCAADGIDVVVEVTGAVEFGAHVALRAIEHGKHVVLMNAELDGTIGPMLKVYADRAGVVLTNADGDQPGVTMNLYRFVKGLGMRPVLCGNIKGLHDPYRNPTTQENFARRWGQNPYMVTSFADGSKISFEQAIVANATGMGVAKRGMYGPSVPTGTSVTEAADWYPAEALLAGNGIVDYVVGAAPGPGVFVLGTHDHPTQRHYLNLYKLGPGLLLLYPVPSLPFRGTEHHRPCRTFPRRRTDAARGYLRRGGRYSQDRSRAGPDPRSDRRLHDVRAMRERRCGPFTRSATLRSGRGLSTEARSGRRPGAHLRRC